MMKSHIDGVSIMNKKLMKERVCKAIDDNRELIIDYGRKIYDKPQLGYKEVYATEVAADALEELGLNVEKNIAVTGCRARFDSDIKGPRIAVLGELDAIVCSEHADAHPQTGAIHACGHNIQVASMLGVAVGLLKSNVLEELSGAVDFIAVPAEEYVELDFRNQLRSEGKITYFGGKQELIHKGYFDDVDISMMIHALDLKGKKILTSGKGNGFVGKKVNFIGKESHAGGAPELGVNALNAAMLAINNIHAQRETFPESEKIRVHPIITKGGDIVNVVPADVRMEMYVRGRSIPGIVSANEKVNRALKAGALAVGAEVKIEEIPGYLPLLTDDTLDDFFTQNVSQFVDSDDIISGGDFTGSFDFGDVSHLMPTLHPFIGGVSGDLHTREFTNADEELSYITSAKAMAMTIVDLLCDDAKAANELLRDYRPEMTKNEYLALLESFQGEA